MSTHLPTVFSGDDGVLRTTSENIADFTGESHSVVRSQIHHVLETGAFLGTNDIRITESGYDLTEVAAPVIIGRLFKPQAVVWAVKYARTFNLMKEALASRAERHPPALPYHMLRYMANKDNVPIGHFSVLTETALLLFGCLESAGYQLPEKLLPDDSVGQWWCRDLRNSGIDTKQLNRFPFKYPDGRRCRPYAYPDDPLLPRFRRFFWGDWMINQAPRYFEERDPVALAYLPSICRASVPKPHSRGPCESPIEDALLRAVQKIDGDVEIITQAQIGKYRADFLFPPNLVVECDGHNFHEKTPDQASNDKARDRWMQQHGFVVFRFTGSDITHTLPKCVGQIISFIRHNQIA